MSKRRAIVVGSGPNGLAAAIEIARAGFIVTVYEGSATPGGGCRTLPLIQPDHLHDVCAAAHPIGAASPFFGSVPLPELEWITPDVSFSHPLGGGRAVGAFRSVAETVELLGPDGDAYRKLMKPIIDDFHRIVAGALRPLQEGWRSPLVMARFGLRAVRSITALAGRFETDGARALLAGLGAHSITRLDAAATGGVALLLGAAAHAVGWPIAKGGSQSIVDGLVAELERLGGSVVTSHPITDLEGLDDDVPVFFDTSPASAAAIGGRRINKPDSLAKWAHGPGSHKVDWTLSDPIPWADELSTRTATVHIGGSFEEIARSEADVVAGKPPTNPFGIVTQPSLFDTTRAPIGRHIGWGYIHTPAGYSEDATAVLEAQIERFAPGFRDTIVQRHVLTAQGLEQYNPNYVGGDIAGGAMSLWRLLARPRLSLNPYRIGDKTYLCSASTPPGAGVHGMCGFNAARYALGDLS
ncbi:MAG: NAD(P)/FAD-dependent oxidoreductase [Acidimicrobiia bacterium]|nr:NAD(P)/FAD-dependent oxidoreductase [Acidimicrobiia bacterium]